MEQVLAFQVTGRLYFYNEPPSIGIAGLEQLEELNNDETRTEFDGVINKKWVLRGEGGLQLLRSEGGLLRLLMRTGRQNKVGVRSSNSLYFVAGE